ncbi:MAG: oxidoreductase [Vicingaceae bacterium]|nr:oxidoreductase [Vicingaceae bacterium]
MGFNINNLDSQKGKIAIVTGANSGLGKEITIGLLKVEIKVIMACRNLEKAEKAKLNIIKKVPSADVEIMQLDLSRLASVRSFVKSFSKKYNQLDLLIENAGIMIPPYVKTEDGFESQMGVNYFGHFLLTNLLMPILKNTEGARIATTSSIAHQNGRINFNNINAEESYSKMGAYTQSKLACLMFALELQRRLSKTGSNVIAVSSHPGVSNTNLFSHIPKLFQLLMIPLLPFFAHPPKKAALPMLYAALGKDINGGDYLGPMGYKNMKGKPGKTKAELHAFDEEVAKKLWEISEKLTGEKFELSN